MRKKAQIGETMTWVVATIIIIIILIISVIIVSSSPFRGMRKFGLTGNNDLLVAKSFMGYLLTENNKGVVYSQLKDLGEKAFIPTQENIKNPGLINLAKLVFRDLYTEEYPDPFWIGVVHKNRRFRSGSFEPASNTFGIRNDRAAIRHPHGRFFYGNVTLDEELITELILVKYLPV